MHGWVVGMHTFYHWRIESQIGSYHTTLQNVDGRNTIWLSQSWKSAKDLMIPEIWRNNWTKYIGALDESLVR